jgi:hypothetical protein
VLADNLQSTSQLSTPEIHILVDLLADNLESTSQVSQPALARIPNLLADNLQSTSQVSTPTIAQTHVALADNLQSVSSVTTPTTAATSVLLADNLQSVSSVTTPTLSSVTAGKAILSVVPNTLQSGETGVVVTVTGIDTDGANVYINDVLQTVTARTENTLTMTTDLTGVTLGQLYLRVAEA